MRTIDDIKEEMRKLGRQRYAAWQKIKLCEARMKELDDELDRAMRGEDIEDIEDYE